jgi:predicted Zn-dependent peptidase
LVSCSKRTFSVAASPRVLLIDKPGTQTYFVIAQPGVRRATPDRVPLILVNTLFGGRFTSMINDALRVNSGLTYGASSTVQMGRLDGAITINSYTKTDTTEKTIDMALDVLKSLGDKGLTADQLASVKAYVKGEYPTRTVQTADLRRSSPIWSSTASGATKSTSASPASTPSRSTRPTRSPANITAPTI